MSFDRFLSVVYCDDVRFEVGGKHSLIGCYAGDLLVETMPAVLPKLCIFAQLYTPIEKPFGRLVFKGYRDDELFGEVGVPSAELTKEGPPPRAGATRAAVGAFITLSPLSISEASVLRVEAETEDGTVIGNRLYIGLRSEFDARHARSEEIVPGAIAPTT